MAAREVNDVAYQVLCENEGKKIKFTHKWVIRDFYYTWYYIYDDMTSGPFQLPEHLGRGFLLLSTEFSEEDLMHDDEFFGPPRPWVSMTINFAIDLPTLVVAVRAYAVNSNGQKTNVRKGAMGTNGYGKNIEIKLDKLITPDELYEWKSVEIDTVTIFCDFTIITDIDRTVDKHHHQVLPLEYSLANELKILLNDQKHSDVTITVGNKTFHAHKLILCSRSSVFQAMFEHKMKENKSSNIDITDMSEEVVGELLNFIYTDTTDKIDEMPLELLDAAEKYDVKNLKLLCAQSLHKSLNIGNAVDTLILADRYNAKEVKEYIMKFIISHKKELMNTTEYNAMKKTH